MGKQKQLDANPKAIQVFIRQRKNPDDAIVPNEFMFVLKTSIQLSKLESAETIKAGTILKINKKNFQDE